MEKQSMSNHRAISLVPPYIIFKINNELCLWLVVLIMNTLDFKANSIKIFKNCNKMKISIKRFHVSRTPIYLVLYSA